MRREHTFILRILNALEERLSSWKNSPGVIDVDFVVRVLEFSRVYVDRCHHGKEEGCLLPCFEARGMRRAGGPIEVILREHEAGRALIRQISSAVSEYEKGMADARKILELCREYIELIRQHINKEELMFFPMGERLMTERDRGDVLDCYKKLDADVGQAEISRMERFSQESIES